MFSAHNNMCQYKRPKFEEFLAEDNVVLQFQRYEIYRQDRPLAAAKLVEYRVLVTSVYI